MTCLIFGTIKQEHNSQVQIVLKHLSLLITVEIVNFLRPLLCSLDTSSIRGAHSYDPNRTTAVQQQNQFQNFVDSLGW